MHVSTKWVAVIAAGSIAVIVAMVLIPYIQSGTILREKKEYANVTFEDLKEEYKIGQPIDFYVKVQGYGCDRGFPTVSIIKLPALDNQTQREVVWSRLGEIRLFPAGNDCPVTDFYQVRHIGDVMSYQNNEQERLRTDGGVPIIMKQEGRYVVEVDGGNVRGNPVEKEFRVVS